jgi:hypothetical protein
LKGTAFDWGRIIDGIVVVFIIEIIWLENSLSQSEEEVKGRGHVRVEKQTVEGKDYKWRPVVRTRVIQNIPV